MYYEFQLSLVENGYSVQEDLLSTNSFRKLWRKDFRWLKTRRAKGIKNTCAICEDLQVKAVIEGLAGEGLVP